MAMFRSLFLLALCFPALLRVEASTVTISGQAPNFQNSELFFIAYTDEVSRQPEVLAEASTSEEGNFLVTLNIESTRRVTLRTGAWRVDFYAEPGRTYEVTVSKPHGDMALRFDNNALIMTFAGLAEDDPNFVMSYFARRYDELFREIALELAVRLGKGSTEVLRADSTDTAPLPQGIAEAFASFVDELQSLLSPTSDPFTADLVRGALGRLDLALGAQRATVDELWLGPRPDLTNPELIGLFAELHALAFNGRELSKEGFKTGLATSQWALCRDALNNYALLEHEHDQLLYTLIWLRDHGAASVMGKKQAVEFLKMIGDTDLLGFGALAGRMRSELIRGSRFASPLLPNLVLTDEKGDRFSLQDLQGELVYLSVIRLGSAASEREMMSLEPVYNKFGRQVRFVTLVMASHEHELRNYLADHRGREWTFLMGGHHPLLKHALRLETVPAFYLIGPDGALLEDQTRTPSEGVHDTFVRLLRDTGSGRGKGRP